jgi:hypothetical protein
LNTIPGPQDYSPKLEVVKKKSPITLIRVKNNLTKCNNSRKTSPGPGEYSPERPFGKNGIKHSFPCEEKLSMTIVDNLKMQNPSPSTYFLPVPDTNLNRAPRGVIGTAVRPTSALVKKNHTPGPPSYEPKSLEHSASAPRYSFS